MRFLIFLTTKFAKIENFVKNRNEGLGFQKPKIRVYDFKSWFLLGLTISKRDVFAKSFFFARVNDFKTQFFCKTKNGKLGLTISKSTKMEIRVNDPKWQNLLGLTISKCKNWQKWVKTKMSRGEKSSFGEFDKFTKFAFSEKFPNRWRTRTCWRNRQNQVRFVTRTDCVIVKMFYFLQKSQKNILPTEIVEIHAFCALVRLAVRARPTMWLRALCALQTYFGIWIWNEMISKLSCW